MNQSSVSTNLINFSTYPKAQCRLLRVGHTPNFTSTSTDASYGDLTVAGIPPTPTTLWASSLVVARCFIVRLFYLLLSDSAIVDALTIQLWRVEVASREDPELWTQERSDEGILNKV